jgi:hypothetical protein
VASAQRAETRLRWITCPPSTLSRCAVWQRLVGAVVLIDGAADWCVRDDGASAPPRAILERVAAAAGPVLLRLPPDARWHAALGALRTARVELRAGTVGDRADAWRHAVRRTADALLDDDESLALADRFDLTPGSIARVVRRARDEGALDDAHRPADVARRLAESARADSCDALAGLAARAPTPHGWEDLVLPAPTMARLRDFAAAVRDRAIVLDRWGFGKRATRARRLPRYSLARRAVARRWGRASSRAARTRSLRDRPGTITSKYIGETEKQLKRCPLRETPVQLSSTRDALFGKRSEVKDAHDRYAASVAYLLQQLDVHDGIVILATNLSRNLDAAFSRRMRYVLEFPLPSEADRLRLWRGIFPHDAPLAPDVDLEFLAARFTLAGGDIRNVAIESAYLAAADTSGGDTIAMRHVIRAMACQMVKQGKTPSAGEFGPYVALIDRDG